MNSKQLFMLIDKIDERYIDEAWGGGNEIYGDIDIDFDYNSEMRRGVNVVIEHKPLRVFTPVVVTAACMLLFVAGGFTALNVFRGGLLAPGSRVENPASYIESTDSSESSSSSTSSEYSESDTSDESNEPDELSSEKPITDMDGDGIYELYQSIPPGGEVHSEAAEKPDNRDFALIEVKETNATEDHPIIAQILKSVPKAGMEPISEEMYITGPGTYELRYTTLRGAGSYSYLYLAYPDWYDYGETDHEAIIVGTWSP